MSTDSVIRIADSENVTISTMYARFDTHLETFLEEMTNAIKKHCSEVIDDGLPGRLNWDFGISKAMMALAHERMFRSTTGVFKFIPEESFNEAKYIIYKYELKPIEAKYGDFNCPIEQAVEVTISRPRSGEIIYQGTLADFEPPKPEY
ncbi:hypothetical protein [Vibrio owensii]|uniref:hypothetical protein n=1 Tax=Vibrio owensii TaxID=696485 RepID=UPI003CC554E5